MNETYSEMVARLAKPGEDILASLTPEKCHIWHMSSALLGEATELLGGLNWLESTRIGSKEYWEAYDNLIEELGDCYFYHTAIKDAFNFQKQYDSCTSDSLSGLVNRIVIESGKVFDAYKKLIVYDKPELQTTRVHSALSQLEDHFYALAIKLNKTLIEVSDQNQMKLTGKGGRYENGYSDEAAQLRADKVAEA